MFLITAHFMFLCLDFSITVLKITKFAYNKLNNEKINVVLR